MSWEVTGVGLCYTDFFISSWNALLERCTEISVSTAKMSCFAIELLAPQGKKCFVLLSPCTVCQVEGSGLEGCGGSLIQLLKSLSDPVKGRQLHGLPTYIPGKNHRALSPFINPPSNAFSRSYKRKSL